MHFRQIIEELTISKNTQKNEEIKMIHQSEKKDQMIQTGEEKEISKNSLLEEAMMLVNKHDPKMKSSVYGGQDSKREVRLLFFLVSSRLKKKEPTPQAICINNKTWDSDK